MSLFRALLALLLWCTVGCAVTSKGTPLDVRSYTPTVVHPTTPSQADASRPLLRLGRVSSGIDLGVRIAYGDGAYEAGYYEGRRWTERPENYVRIALGRALFEEGTFQRAVEGGVPTLDVKVREYGEIRSPHSHAGRVTLHILLSTDRILLEDTIAATEPVAGDRFDDVVAAISRAQEAAAEETARRVNAAMGPH